MAWSKPDRAQEWKEALRKCRVSIVSKLDVNDIINVLISSKVLTADRAKLIQTPIDKHTRSEQIELVLTHLSRRPEEEMIIFVESLQEEYMDIYQTLVEEKNKGMPSWIDVVKKKRWIISRDVDVRGYIINQLISNSVIDEDKSGAITNTHELRTEQRQAENLLNFLRRKTELDFRLFLQSLEESSYKDLKKKLEVAMTKEQGKDGWKQVLTKHRVSIVKTLRVEDVMDYLIANGVLDEDKKEEIRMPATETRRRQVEDLLDFLGRRTEADFITFWKLLEEDFNELYQEIEKVLSPNFLGENRGPIAQPEQEDGSAAIITGINSINIGNTVTDGLRNTSPEETDENDGGTNNNEEISGNTMVKNPEEQPDTDKNTLRLVQNKFLASDD